MEKRVEQEAFVYLWYDASNKKYYLGKHKGTPDDGYTHSSTIWEAFTKDTIPEGVSRRILAYGTHEEMCILEHELLVDRKKRCWDRYYNESLGDPRYVDISGFARSEETKRKISIANTGKSHTEEAKEKIKIARANQLNDKEYLDRWERGVKSAALLRKGENNHMYGKSHTEETKKKISETKKKQYANGEAIHPSTYTTRGKEHQTYKHGKLINARNDPEVRRLYKAEWHQRKKAERQGESTLDRFME